MKTRQGFVSNSSSSSFLIIGINRGDFSTIDKIKFEKYKTYAMVGTDLEEGLDLLLFDMSYEEDRNLLQWFKDNRAKIPDSYLCGNESIYEVLECGASPLVLDKEVLAKTEDRIICFNVDRDYDSTNSIKKAREVYLGEYEEDR